MIFWTLLKLMAFIVSATYLYFRLFVFKFWYKKGVPYAKPTFPVGNMLDGVLNKKSYGEIFANFYFKYKCHPYVGIFFIYKPSLVLIDLKMIHFVLVEGFIHFHDRGLYCNEAKDPLSGNLFLLSGKKWRNLKVLLSQNFTIQKIKSTFKILKEKGSFLQGILEDEAKNGNEIEMKEVSFCFFIDVIMEIAYGIESDCLENQYSVFNYWIKTVFASKPIKNAMFLFTPELLKIFSIPYIERGASNFFIKIFNNVIKYRKEYGIVKQDFLELIIHMMEKGCIQNDIKQNDSVLSNPRKLSMLEGAAHSFSHYLIGLESLSATVSFCLYELAFNQKIQKNIHQEIEAILEIHGKITYEAIKEMTYLDMVVLETLRKYPTQPILNRICTNDVQLPDSKLIISKGTSIVIPVLGLHRDPQYYPKPERFIPERFTNQEINYLNYYDYMPFGMGPRMCPGLLFGSMQVKVALVNALYKYKYTPGPNTPNTIEYLKGSLTLNSRNNLYLKIQLRY